eukprot:3892362-Pyramimonas_sp.AAC.1
MYVSSPSLSLTLSLSRSRSPSLSACPRAQPRRASWTENVATPLWGGAKVLFGGARANLFR